MTCDIPLDAPILVVRPPWLELLLDGAKTLEIRGTRCAKPAGTRVYLSESCMGTVAGYVTFAGCEGPFEDLDAFRARKAEHRVGGLEALPYKATYGWRFEGGRRLDTPVPYMIKKGSIVWRKFRPVVVEAPAAAQPTVHVYTDGACRNNGQQGARAGYGVYFGEDHALNVSARVEGDHQTNQVAELMAIRVAHERIHAHMPGSQVVVHTDSKYSIDCLTTWHTNWERNGWVNQRTKKPVKNQGEIRAILGLRSPRITLAHVRAHQSAEAVKEDPHALGNARADVLAVAGAEQDQQRRPSS